MEVKEVFSDKLKKNLIEGEKVLWDGKPNSKVPFHIFFFVVLYIIISLYACIVAVFLEVKSIVNNGSISFIYLLIFFLAILFGFSAIYMIVIEKKIIWKNTIYAITDKRVLVIVGGDYNVVITKYINEISYVGISEISIKKNGMGTIIFGETVFSSVFGETKFPSAYVRDIRNKHAIKYSYIGSIPIFNDIYDAMEVYNLVNNLRNKI